MIYNCRQYKVREKKCWEFDEVQIEHVATHLHADVFFLFNPIYFIFEVLTFNIYCITRNCSYCGAALRVSVNLPSS